MYRATLIATALFALGTAFAAADDPVRLDTGMISGFAEAALAAHAAYGRCGHGQQLDCRAALHGQFGGRLTVFTA